MSTETEVTISTRVPVELEKKFSSYAREYKKSPEILMREYIEDCIEDREMENSVTLQERVRESRNSKRIPAEEVYRELGLM